VYRAAVHLRARADAATSIVRWIAIAGLVALAMWSGYLLADHSGDPRYYYEHRNGSPLDAYPTAQVVEALGVIAGELGIAWVVLFLARKTQAPVRLLAVCALFGIQFLIGLPFAMHSPPYYGGDLVFVALASGWAFVMAIVAFIVQRVFR
jgi:hypothetical protein